MLMANLLARGSTLFFAALGAMGLATLDPDPPPVETCALVIAHTCPDA